jgi:hypothetical protein
MTFFWHDFYVSQKQAEIRSTLRAQHEAFLHRLHNIGTLSKKKKKAKQSTATCTVALVSAIPSPIRDPMSRLENFSSSSGHSRHFFLLRHKRMNNFAFLQYAHTTARPA